MVNDSEYRVIDWITACKGDTAADVARLSEWLTDSERDKLLKLIRNRLVNEAERYYHG